MSEDKSLYRDGKIYDAMNDALISDAHFYLKEFANVQGSILELACGTGRITLQLAHQKKNITGLDLSVSMLEEARRKTKSLNMNVHFHHADMTNFDLGKKFDVIFVAYNSVHHIQTSEKFESFLASVKKHLNSNGRLYFDIFNPSLAMLTRASDQRYEMDDYIDPVSGDHVFVTENNKYDPATQINHVTYYYSKEGHPDFHIHPLDMRCYFPQEIDTYLRLGGFKIINKYGGFDKSAFSGTSMKQIFEVSL